MKLLLVFGLVAGVAVLGLPLLVVAVIATHPWLAGGMLAGAIQVRDDRPAAVRGGVPAAQWSLMVSAAQASTCGVAPRIWRRSPESKATSGRTCATRAREHSDMASSTSRRGPRSGQVTPITRPMPSGDRPNAVRARYATDRTRALNSYGGCTAPHCLGDTDYATAVNRLATGLKPAQGIVQSAEQWLGVPYVFGGCSRSGVDCSCLVQHVFGSM